VSDLTQALADDLFAIHSRAGREVTYVTEGGERRPYWPNRYLQALKRAVEEAANGNEKAIPEFAERLVTQSEPSRGFHYLHAANRLDLSVEVHVADASRPYHGLFSAEARDAARSRLAEYGYELEEGAGEGPEVPFLLALHYDVVKDRAKTSAERLSSLVSLSLNLEGFKQTLVRDARNAGVAWAEIALRLGVTQEDAARRFGMTMPNGPIV
jgi:hypothetical protein